MKKTLVPFLLFFLLPHSRLGALPASLENGDYKVGLSETLPGLDNQGVPPTGAAITVTVTDKFRSNTMLYNVDAYAINSYFLLEDTLNLVARTTVAGNQVPLRFDFLQLALANPPDSRQFKNLRQYSLSPDHRSLLVVMDQGDDKPPLVGMADLSNPPARMGLIYGQPAGVNLFKAAFAGPVSTLVLNDPVGWTADGGTAAFVLSVGDGSQDAQGKPVVKDYLAVLQQTDKGWTGWAQPADLSPYHFHQGGVVTDLQCSGGQARLFLTDQNSTSPAEVDFKLSPP